MAPSRAWPCLDRHPHATGPLGPGACPPGGRPHPPGPDALARHAALPARAGGQRSRVDATATVHNPRPHRKAPATGVPRHALDGVGDGLPRHRGQPQPGEGLHPVRGSTSRPCTAPRATAGQPSAWRCRGGCRVQGQHRRASVASRPGCGPRRGTCPRRGSTTGCASPVAHTERSGALTARSQAARITSATPAGRSAARRA